jgi:hypothetical protein
MKTATKWKERAKEDRKNRIEITKNQIENLKILTAKERTENMRLFAIENWQDRADGNPPKYDTEKYTREYCLEQVEYFKNLKL